jgi:two-component sensor histidine kinase
VWSVAVPHRAQSAGVVRHKLAADLAGLLEPETLADVITVIAELVGNAIRHASALDGDVIRVAWSVHDEGSDQVIEVSVTDGGGPTQPHRRPYDVTSPDGRGIAIIEALSRRWGTDRNSHGQRVWAEVTGPRPERHR